MIPISLELKNFFSHKDSFIDFTLFNSAILIGNIDGDYDQSNGSGKCLAGQTILTHAMTGEKISIKDLHEKKIKDFFVLGLDKDEKLRPKKIIATQYSGKKNILKIETKNNITEYVSETHPIVNSKKLTTTPASLLKVGDCIAQPQKLICEKTNENSLDSDIRWIEIKSISEVGEQDTYDIEIDSETHLYALEGFITHNSSILEGISWCLFNKSRSAAMDDIIFWGESFCKVEFVFKHSNEIYRITRKRIKSSSTTNVDFCKKDSFGKWIDISGSTSSLTNSEIEKAIKLDYKTFINSIYFRQNDISEFSEADPARKKEILKSIIDLSKWDIYEEKCKFKLKELRQDVKILDSKLQDLNQNFEILNDTKLKLGIIETKLSSNLNQRDQLQDLFYNLSDKYQNLKNQLDTNKWDQVTDNVKKIESELNNINSKIKLIQNNLNNYDLKISEKNHQLEQYRNKITTLSIDDNIDSKLEILNQDLVDYKAKLNTSLFIIKNLTNKNFTSGECYVCKQTISDELHSHLILENQNEKNELERQKIYYQNKINEIEFKAKNLEEIKKNNSLFEKINSKIKEVENEKNIFSENKNVIESELNHLNLNKESFQQDLKINLEILESLKDNQFQELHSRISLIKNDLKLSQLEVEKNSQQVGMLKEKVASLEEKIKNIELFKSEYLEKQQRIYVLEKLNKFLGKNGIQTILLNAVILDLEKTSNNILTSICNEPFEIFIDTQRVGSDGVSIVDTLDLRIKKDGVIQSFKSLSGGEQFRISLALRIALSEIASRHGGSSLEFLLLDEINSPLDRQGTESLFVNIIRSLEKKYKILVITHNDLIKEKFDHILEISKINGESSISYISTLDTPSNNFLDLDEVSNGNSY